MMSTTIAAFRSLAVTAVLTLNAGLALADGVDRDPLGETADYEVDRNSSRTSSLVRGGSMHTEVTRHLPDATPPSYEVKIDYTFRLQIGGTRSGTQRMAFEEKFFTAEFLDELRTSGEYQGATFKIRHLGYADARNMDGRFYPNCDKILIYDIQQERAPLAQLARDILSDQLEDMEIVAHIKYGEPVLGAVKMDISGKYQGVSVKAGADYKAP